MSLSDQAVAEMIYTLRQVVDANLELVQMQRAALPQWFEGEDLRKRWCLGQHGLVDLLVAHGLYQGKQGKPIRIHIDDVLQLDVVMKRQRSLSRKEQREIEKEDV